MRKYETLFIFRPDLSDDQIQAVVGRMREIVESRQGKPVSISEWGDRKLSYTIKYRGERFKRGQYVLFTYLDQGESLKEIDRVSKLIDEVIRAQTVKLEDYVDPSTVTEMTVTRESFPEQQDRRSGGWREDDEEESFDSEDDGFPGASAHVDSDEDVESEGKKRGYSDSLEGQDGSEEPEDSEGKE